LASSVGGAVADQTSVSLAFAIAAAVVLILRIPTIRGITHHTWSSCWLNGTVLRCNYLLFTDDLIDNLGREIARRDSSWGLAAGRILLGSQWRSGRGESIDMLNPAAGTVLTGVHSACAEHVDEAVEIGYAAAERDA
jgi:hypothetical protein